MRSCSSPGQLAAVEFAFVLFHQDAHHLIESGIHQAARFGQGLRAQAFKQQMQAVFAVHDGETAGALPLAPGGF